MAKAESKAKAAVDSREFREIPIAAIEIGAQMIRHDQHDDDIQELAGSIARRGLLQPIGVCPGSEGRWQLLWGSRRLAAHQRLARSHILARICDACATEDVIATASVENLLRRDLTLAEEIDAVRRLTGEGLSPAQISDLVGKSRNWVDRRLAFDSLAPGIRDYVLAGDLPLGHAEALGLVEDPGTQNYFLHYCLQNRPSLAALRATLEAVKNTPTFGQAIEEGTAIAQQTLAAPTVHLPCHACDEPKPLDALVIVRVCGDCAAALAHCAAHTADAPAQH